MGNVKKPILAIMDSDCFMFFAGWEYREQLNLLGEIAAKKKLDKIISGILSRIKADYYIGFFGGVNSKNFRYDVATIKPYKGTRKNPDWQEYFKPILKQHYIDQWGFIPMYHIEADDAVIIAHHQYKNDYDIIHVGEDKDQKQLGEFKRYNPRDNILKQYNHEEGRKFFYSQILHGK